MTKPETATEYRIRYERQRNLRRVSRLELIYDNKTKTHQKEYLDDGHFHEWGQVYDGEFIITVGLVELANGEIVEWPPNLIKFNESREELEYNKVMKEIKEKGI